MKNNITDLINSWKDFSNYDNHNLIEKCLKISQILFNKNLNIYEYIKRIRIPSDSDIIKIVHTMNNIEKILCVLNQYIFNQQIKCERNNNHLNNFVDFVIDNKKGNSLTLAIIYSEIANQIGLNMKIIEANNSFMCRYNNIIINPQNLGPILKINNDHGYKKQTNKDLEQDVILIKLLQNLKLSYVRSYAYGMASICIDMILSIRLIPQEIRDKGIIEELSLNHKNALDLLNYYLKLEPDSDDVDYVLELIENIHNKINQ
ncbi:MAG: hypothetical protein KAF24_00140 [Nitrosopumilaceae archaeon]|nr:hypothetical protein [Nitrosopumilaceae archaeon]